MRALVLGAYGFIGLEVARKLVAAGHEVIGVGRSAETGRRLLPGAQWITVDLATLHTADVWSDYLESIDVVVNASGALQSGLRDDVEVIHHAMIAALVAACEASGVKRFIQISAVGATQSATTEFMRSKARGDDCVRSSSLDWFIVRPGLVIGSNAYGGTALIRMVSSIPLIQPIVVGDRRVQTIAASDLAEVVLDAVDGHLPAQSEFDLVEQETHTLRSVIQQFRAWLGISSARIQLEVPEWLLVSIAKVADGLGYLGWRSPLRTTAIRVLSGDVVGDPSVFQAMSQRELSSLAETLESIPSTLQERWFARLYLAMPVAVAVLAVFWVLSGLIAMLNLEEASAITGLGPGIGEWVVGFGAVVDIGLGLAVLYRPWSKRACWGMALVTVAYLMAGSVLRPELWSDPLGPLLKTLPALTLALIAGLLLEER